MKMYNIHNIYDDIIISIILPICVCHTTRESGHHKDDFCLAPAEGQGALSRRHAPKIHQNLRHYVCQYLCSKYMEQLVQYFIK